MKVYAVTTTIAVDACLAPLLLSSEEIRWLSSQMHWQEISIDQTLQNHKLYEIIMETYCTV